MTPDSLMAGLAVLVSPLAGAGLAMVNSGLGRSRSAAHTMLGSVLLMGLGALAYFVCGAAVMSAVGLAVNLNGHSLSWIGWSGFFLHGVDWNGPSPNGLVILHGMLCASIVAMIPLGAGSDRCQLTAVAAIGALLAGILFPLFGHWVWSEGGWLKRLDEIAGLTRGFADTGGAGAIHVTAGSVALALVWMAGPRQGKYNESGLPAAVPGHDAVLSMTGALVALIGWFGLNCGTSLLYGKVSLFRLPLVGINTILCAAGGAVAAAVFTKSRYGRPDASLCANGWCGGLVASSAAAAFVDPAAAALIGLAAGAMVPLAIELMDVHLGFDDPGGTVAVHFLCGLWGLLAVGLVGSGDAIAQIVGVATLLGVIFPAGYGMVWLIGRLTPLRTNAEGDRQGMDLHELGAGAYPEFVTYHEDSWGR